MITEDMSNLLPDISYFQDTLMVQFLSHNPKYFSRISYTAWKVSVFEVLLVPMRENMDQKISEYGHFLCSVDVSIMTLMF